MIPRIVISGVHVIQNQIFLKDAIADYMGLFLEIAKTIAQSQNPTMQTFTTKGATDLLYADDFRSNGCPDVWCIQNESGTVELEALRFRLR
jgi:hypothetical protein